MKADKRNYKYAVRRIKSRSSEAQLDTLGCNLLEGSYAQFWKSVQKLKSSRGLRAHTINGSSTEFGIARMWRDHFARIHDMDNIGRSHQQRECLHRVVSDSSQFTVTANMVETAISKLKGNKAPGMDDLYEEHFKYAPGCVRAHLATLYTAMLLS